MMRRSPLLRQQLRLMEQKLDKLQRQTTANTAAAANANAKADAKVSVANANAAYPVKGPVVAAAMRWCRCRTTVRPSAPPTD